MGGSLMWDTDGDKPWRDRDGEFVSGPETVQELEKAAGEARKFPETK
jgi:hypothetical protein